MPATTSPPTTEASEHLYQVLRNLVGMNFAADQPIIRAISAYGEACRGGDTQGQAHANEALYHAIEQLTGHNFAVNQPIIAAIAAYGQACRRAGRTSLGR